MNIFGKNFSVLKNKYPGYVDKILSAKPQNAAVSQSKSGLPTARVIINGKELLIHSAYDPKKEAKTIADNIPFSRTDIVVLCGIGLGYVLFEIAERNLPDLKIFAVIRETEIFRLALDNLDWTLALNDARVEIIMEENPVSAVEKVIREYDGLKHHGIKWLVNPQVSRIYPDAYSEFISVLGEEFQHREMLIRTTMKFANTWQENILKNINVFAVNPSVEKLFGRFKNMPCIIISAGPSLDSEIENLKNVRNRALIICVDTAFKTLVSNGIYPELTISIDVQKGMLNAFEGANISRTFLVAGTTTYHGIVKLFGEKSFIHSANHPIEEWLFRITPKKGELDTSGGSVSNVAFDLAKNMGCSPVIFAGLDLAYPKKVSYTGGSHHSENLIKSTNKFKSIESINRRLALGHGHKVKGIDGTMLYTSYSFLCYLKWIEREIEKLKNVEIVNCSKGAFIKGTRHSLLEKEIKNTLKTEYDFLSLINSLCRQEATPGLRAKLKQLGKTTLGEIEKIRILTLYSEEIRNSRAPFYEKEDRFRTLEKQESEQKRGFLILDNIYFANIFNEYRELIEKEPTEENQIAIYVLKQNKLREACDFMKGLLRNKLFSV